MIESILKDKIKEINQIKLTEAVYKQSENICYLSFLVDKSLDAELQKDALLVCKEALKLDCALKFKTAIYDEDAVKFIIKNFLKIKYLNILEMLEPGDVTIEKNEENIKIKFALIEDLKNLAQKNGFINEVKEVFASNFFEKFEIEFVEKSGVNLDDAINEMKAKIMPATIKESFKYVKVIEPQEFIGNKIANVPVALECVKYPTEGINICGTVKFLNERTYKKKNKSGETEEKPFYTFVLDDGTGSINCTYFVSKANLPKMQKITNDTKILCFGAVELFNERLSFRPKDISLILGFEPITKEVIYNKVSENYQLIFPEIYQKPTQISLIEDLKEEVKKLVYPASLENKEVVVFDIETTGLNPERDEIIEIGACKIIKGEITETFGALIKPTISIPEEASRINGITDEMVENCPLYADVVGDFHKFCNNCVLVAYNASFDKSFIDIQSKRHNYKFDNEVIDAMIVAQQQFKGLRNYKLKTVLEKLGIINEGAHRAVHDAVATAKAFLIMAKNM